MFGSNDPNMRLCLGRPTQTSGFVWVERPKHQALFGSSDPNISLCLGHGHLSCRMIEAPSFVWVHVTFCSCDPNISLVWVVSPNIIIIYFLELAFSIYNAYALCMLQHHELSCTCWVSKIPYLSSCCCRHFGVDQVVLLIQYKL